MEESYLDDENQANGSNKGIFST